MRGDEKIAGEGLTDAGLAARLLVVIPALNEAAHIEACITSLIGGDPSMAKVSCIVADGGSTDGTRDIVDSLKSKFANLRWIDNPGRLQAAGVNAAARAGGEAQDILVRCDAHATYPPDYLLRVARALIEHGSDSLVVPMDAAGAGCFQKANAWVVDTPLGSGGSAHRGGRQSGYVDHGHHAGFMRARFLELGGYDESFSHNEDAEYDARLAAAGGKVFLDADIRIRYFPRDTVTGLWRQYFGYGRGRARNVLKNELTMRPRQLAPVINFILLVLTVLLAPFAPWLLFWPSLYVGLLVSVSLWLVVIKRSLCGLYGGVALGAMHLAWGAGFIAGTFGDFRRRAV